MSDNKKIIRVSSRSPVPQLAGSIIISIEEGSDVELRACGASAVSQMYKGIAAARGTLSSKGKDLFIKPGFGEVIDKNEVTGEEEKKTIMLAILVVK